MSRVGNVPVSTHVRTPASCTSGPVHLSACVSARQAVWRPLLQTLPDFQREQLHYFPHGDERSRSFIHPHTLTLAARSKARCRRLTSACVMFMASSRACSRWLQRGITAKDSKRMQKSRHTQTRRWETYNRLYPLRNRSALVAWGRRLIERKNNFRHT